MQLFLLLSVCLIVVGCATSQVSLQPDILTTERMEFALKAHPPKDFAGPGTMIFPSYDSWGYSRGEDPNAAYLQIRVYHGVTYAPDDASDEIEEESFRDMFIDPVVKTIAEIKINNRVIPIREVLNVGGHQLQSNFHYGNSYVNIMLSVEPHRSLAQYRSLRKSLHIV